MSFPQMPFPHLVKSALWKIVDAMALNPVPFVKNPAKDFTRKRKLDFVRMIRFCICMESGCLSHELLKYFYFNPDEAPTASAFVQQRAKLLAQAFCHILKQFNSRFPLKMFLGKYSLIAVDGCEFNIPRNPDDPSTFHPASGRSKKGFNSLHSISLFDLVSKRYLDVALQPGRLKNEFAALCQLIERFPSDSSPIFVADRGFASYNVFAHALEKAFTLPYAPRTSTQCASLGPAACLTGLTSGLMSFSPGQMQRKKGSILNWPASTASYAKQSPLTLSPTVPPNTLCGFG